jgi:hypothetical protein
MHIYVAIRLFLRPTKVLVDTRPNEGGYAGDIRKLVIFLTQIVNTKSHGRERVLRAARARVGGGQAENEWQAEMPAPHADTVSPRRADDVREAARVGNRLAADAGKIPSLDDNKIAGAREPTVLEQCARAVSNTRYGAAPEPQDFSPYRDHFNFRLSPLRLRPVSTFS